MPDQLAIDFDAAQIHGADFQPERDRKRLTGQLEKIYNLMKGGAWFTLQQVADATNAPHASVSANLRNLRKAPFFFTIEREYVGNGLYKYRLR